MISQMRRFKKVFLTNTIKVHHIKSLKSIRIEPFLPLVLGVPQDLACQHDPTIREKREKLYKQFIRKNTKRCELQYVRECPVTDSVTHCVTFQSLFSLRSHNSRPTLEINE